MSKASQDLNNMGPWNLDVFWVNTSWVSTSVYINCWSLLQISNSFGNMDPFGTGQALPPLQLPQTVAPAATSMPLKKPPKWIRRPVGATFAVCTVLLSSFPIQPLPSLMSYAVPFQLDIFKNVFSLQFGGKLVSLENAKPNPQQPQQPTSHVVHISQVVTETEFLKRSEQLQATLGAGTFVDFCKGKIDAAGNEFEKTIWSFLKVPRRILFSQ